MGLQEQVFNMYKAQIAENRESNREGASIIKNMLEHSPLYWNGTVDKTVHIPKVFDEQTLEHFKSIVAVSHRIFEKVIREYREKEDFRRLFDFPKELEELILLPAQYDTLLPMARFDIFYDEKSGNFQFCEINTDGTAAMIRDYELRKALIANPAHQAVIRKYDLEPFELFDSWVEEFLCLYSSYSGGESMPNVAIIDFLENATLPDFYEFARRFQNRGINCEICDIRSLRYKGGVLYSAQGNRIDAVYRRAVTADIMAHYDEVSDFLSAVRDNAVFLAGSFATQIIHTKWLFYVLHHERTRAFLTEQEQEFIQKHVPKTVEFSAKYISLEEVLQNKNRYILKPMDAYASKGVYAAGREHTREQWSALAQKLYEKGYICQEYCKQYFTENIDFAWGDGKWHNYLNMPGLYTYNGKFCGILMRMACEENIIVAHENERTAAVFTLKGKK